MLKFQNLKFQHYNLYCMTCNKVLKITSKFQITLCTIEVGLSAVTFATPESPLQQDVCGFEVIITTLFCT
jgi:hypothetical protein